MMVVRLASGSHALRGRKQLVAAPNRFLHSLVIRGLSPKTVRAYAFDFVVLYRWMISTRRSLERLRHEDLIEYIAAQQASGAEPSTINRRLTTTRLLFKFVTGVNFGGGTAPYYRGRGRDRDLGLHVLRRQSKIALRVKSSHRLVEPLTVTEIKAFIRTLKRHRDLALVYLMLLCGLRSTEILDLDVADADLEGQQLRVRGKGRKERMLPLPPIIVEVLRKYLRWERPSTIRVKRLFVILQGARAGAGMTDAGLRSLFRHRRRTRRSIARANAHRFRHTFGADMARARVRLPILQRMMGHAYATTTLQYINLSMADIADEYRRAHAEIQKRYRA